MIGYVVAATILKLFSICPQTERIYRLVANAIGSRIRLRCGLHKYYADRAREILRLIEKHQLVQNGDRILELGTGWMHWESTVIRLFYECDVTLFDICDNRQLEPFRKWFAEFAILISRDQDIPSRQRKHATGLLRHALSASTFDDLYRLLGFRYIVEPTGTLRRFQDESFDAIISCDVLEHVYTKILAEYVRDFYRLLKPGGYSIHLFDMADHLRIFDKNVCIKNYLRYSDVVWKRYFENKVQYFNRVQRPEWLDFFHGAGLQLVEEQPQYSSIGGIKVNRRYQRFSRKELECENILIIHRKPRRGVGAN